MKRAIKKLVQKVFRTVGLDVHPWRGTRTSMEEVLQHLAERGFQPRTVIDVGVAYGTHELYATFPKAKHLLVEPLAEFEPHIAKVVAAYDCEYVQAAAASREGSITLDVRSEPSWSSVYDPAPEFGVERTSREVKTVTVDGLCREKGLEGPYLLKVDVEGAELDVLAGAAEVLKSTEAVLLEVTFPQEYPEAPTFADVIRTMDEKGFAAYDIFDLRTWHRPPVLHQGDFVFVKRDGFFTKTA
jgi:FkbM family methyltransferase